MKWKLLVGLLVFLLSACGGNEGVTPLMKAARSGDTVELTALIASGAELDKRSKYHWTALMFASSAGHEEAVTILVNAGADVNAPSIEVPSAFSTVAGYGPTNSLSEAIGGRHYSIANFLMEAGAAIDPNSMALAGGQGNIALLERMVTFGGNLNKINENEFHRTALNVASFEGDIKVIKWLLDNGADPNLVIPNSSILYSAVRGIQPEAVELLIDRGADPNFMFGSVRHTALSRATIGHTPRGGYDRKLEVIKILLEKGADPNHRDTNQQISMLERVQNTQANSYKGSMDPNYDEETKERHRRSMEYEEAVIDLLKAHLD